MGKSLFNIGMDTEDKREGKRNYFDKAKVKCIKDRSRYCLLLGDVEKTKTIMEQYDAE